MILSVGSLYTSSVTGYVYEIVALTPEILYSPIQTYTTRVHDSRIFSRKPDDFLSRFTEGAFPIGAILNSSGGFVRNSSGGYVIRSFT